MNFQLWDGVGIYLPRPAARSTETKIVYQGLPLITIGRLATWKETILSTKAKNELMSFTDLVVPGRQANIERASVHLQGMVLALLNVI